MRPKVTKGTAETTPHQWMCQNTHTNHSLPTVSSSSYMLSCCLFFFFNLILYIILLRTCFHLDWYVKGRFDSFRNSWIVILLFLESFWVSIQRLKGDCFLQCTYLQVGHLWVGEWDDHFRKHSLWVYCLHTLQRLQSKRRNVESRHIQHVESDFRQTIS